MKNVFKKTLLFALIAAIAMAAMPYAGVSAKSANDPVNPPQGEVTAEKLEQVWARQLVTYERLGRMFERLGEATAKAQKLIDRAQSNGRDVTALQAALDAFEESAKEAHPIYESGKGIVNSHQGFDENGKVTDLTKARETVRQMHDKLQEIKTAMDGTGKALREAIKAFREANPRPQPTAAPES